MNRRRFLSCTANALGALGLGVEKLTAQKAMGASLAENAPGARSRPNVLIIMSDQHKRSCLGAAGDPVAVTPNLDRLARESICFTNAYCNNPVCAPSRASLMTGLYSHHLETQGNNTPYLPTHLTMAHHFSRAGYMTALIGKMHFVDGQNHGFEYKLEFNDWFQYLGPKIQLYVNELARPNAGGAGLPEIEEIWTEAGNPWKGHWTRDDREGPVSVGRVSLMEEQDHFESFVARESIRFLHNFGKGSQPFFLISSFLKPHDPFTPTQRFADMFQPQQMRLPSSWGKADKSRLPKEVVKSIEFNAPTPEVRDPDQARKHIAFYYANLAQMDDCLGRVVNAVKELNLENDTIICYTADHGEMLGDLGLWQKFQFYEGSCGVPLMFRIPGQKAGACETPVSLVSLSATLTELAGVQQIAPNDGASIAPWVREPQRRAAHEPVFAEFGLSSRQPKWMIREGQWKYTYWLHDIAELYDLKSDSEELRNLAGEKEYATKESELREKLLAWHSPA